MAVVIFQLSTIMALLIITFSELSSIGLEFHRRDNRSEGLWIVRARRLDVPKKRLFSLNNILNRTNEVVLYEDRYLAGNRWIDDLYIDVPGERRRLYINVQPEQLFLTVLKGSIELDYYTYDANKSARIDIANYTKIYMDNVELEFIRK